MPKPASSAPAPPPVTVKAAKQPTNFQPRAIALRLKIRPPNIRNPLQSNHLPDSSCVAHLQGTILLSPFSIVRFHDLPGARISPGDASGRSLGHQVASELRGEFSGKL